MDLGERFHEIRKLRNKSQLEMAEIIGAKTKWAWTKLESGDTQSLKFSQLENIFNTCRIDPRYLFGLTDSIELADIQKYPVQRNLYAEMEEIKNHIAAMHKKIKPLGKCDPVYDFLSHHPEIYKLIDRIREQNLSEYSLRRISDAISVFISGIGATETPGKSDKE